MDFLENRALRGHLRRGLFLFVKVPQIYILLFSVKFEHDPSKFWTRIEGDIGDIERSRNTIKHKQLHKKCTVYAVHGWNIFSVVDFLSYMPDDLTSKSAG